MPVLCFSVQAEDGGWNLRSSFYSARYATRRAALRAAVEAAWHAAQAGAAAEVVALAEDGFTRRLWAFGAHG